MTPTTQPLLPLLLGATLALYGCGDKGDDTAGGGGGDDGASSTTEPEGTNPGECTDGADNDSDGDFDCNDSDCAGSPDCSEANTPGGCSDGADNDQDGLFDCDDPDCASDDACGDGIEGNAPGECDDGVDNDGDGLTDCDDEDCAGFEGCDDYEGDEVGECTDGIDNDSDGLVDCDDEGCAGSPDCEDAVVDMDGDGVPADADCDDADSSVGSADVDDPDCDGVATHAGGGDMIRISAGSFDMGCTSGQSNCVGNNVTVMPVTLTHDYFIGQTEVTQGEYEAVMGSNPAFFTLCSSICPVESVTWHMAAVYANAVSSSSGLTECYTCTSEGLSSSCSLAMDPYTCDGYRLPTEAEWEGAARCGEDLLFSGSNNADDVAWYADNSDATTHPVGLLAPNACSLYDMSGNVAEWTQDLYDIFYYDGGGRTDPTGVSSGTTRVYRGGYWTDRFTSELGVIARRADVPGAFYDQVGFRLARTAN